MAAILSWPQYVKSQKDQMEDAFKAAAAVG